jgi:hypothetical protein
MPVDVVAKVLAAPDIDARNELITAQLSRLVDGLSRTQTAVSSLRVIYLVFVPGTCGVSTMTSISTCASTSASIGRGHQHRGCG